MSKHPSPRLDQLRALREAKYARKNEQRQPEADTDVPPAADTEAPSVTTAPKKKKAKKKTARS